MAPLPGRGQAPRRRPGQFYRPSVAQSESSGVSPRLLRPVRGRDRRRTPRVVAEFSPRLIASRGRSLVHQRLVARFHANEPGTDPAFFRSYGVIAVNTRAAAPDLSCVETMKLESDPNF